MNCIYSSGIRHVFLSPLFALIGDHGKSQAMKFTAATAMPTPKRTPARTRFEPPSPKAKVKPETTIATRERPRAMVLVNACIKTLTAYSQGELPCASTGTAKSKAIARAARFLDTNLGRDALRNSVFIVVLLLR